MPRLKNVTIACIGPTAAQTARDNGLTVDISRIVYHSGPGGSHPGFLSKTLT